MTQAGQRGLKNIGILFHTKLSVLEESVSGRENTSCGEQDSCVRANTCALGCGFFQFKGSGACEVLKVSWAGVSGM